MCIRFNPLPLSSFILSFYFLKSVNLKLGSEQWTPSAPKNFTYGATVTMMQVI